MSDTFTRVLDEQVKRDVEELGRDAIAMLQALTNPNNAEDLKQVIQTESNTLTTSVVAECKAMAFFHMTKGGVAVTYGKGSGFVMQRMDGSSWSAPVLFKVHQWGIGTAIGAEDLNFVVVFNDAAAVHKVIHEPKTKFTADLFVPLTKSLLPGDGGNKVYVLSDGYMFLDIGITGTEIELDKASMDKAYGPGKKVEDVLAAPPLEELAPLYKLLHALSQRAGEDIRYDRQQIL